MVSVVSTVAKQLLDALTQHGDPRVAKQSQVFFKQPTTLLGVNAPTMRLIACQVHDSVKADLTAADAVAVCEKLLPDSRHEVKL
ncbi:MAG TPA: DNA alkylation repair protein, partial [Gemmataceae bacterium]|nr:DNA alkylation repair protein [Gemmataceae bacterium]